MRKIVYLFVVHIWTLGRRQRVASLAREERLSLSKLLGHCHQFAHNAADRPYVNGVAVLTLENDKLRSPVPSGRNMGCKVNFSRLHVGVLVWLNLFLIFHFVLFFLFIIFEVNSSSQPEITQFDLSKIFVVSYQNILGFKIPVQDITFFKIVESQQNLENNSLNFPKVKDPVGLKNFLDVRGKILEDQC
jgi:hypothetical protein